MNRAVLALLSAGLLAIPGWATAQTEGESQAQGAAGVTEPCPAGEAEPPPGAPSPEALCSARIVALEQSVDATVTRLCEDRLENDGGPLFREIREVADDCEAALLRHLDETPEGEDAQRRRHRLNRAVFAAVRRADAPVDTLENLYVALHRPADLHEVDPARLPDFYKKEVLYSQILEVTAEAFSNRLLRPAEAGAGRRQIAALIGKYQEWNGLRDDHPRVRFIHELMRRLMASDLEVFPLDLAKDVLATNPLRFGELRNGLDILEGDCGDEETDTAVRTILGLVYASHVVGNGPGKNVAQLRPHVGAARGALPKGSTALDTFLDDEAVRYTRPSIQATVSTHTSQDTPGDLADLVSDDVHQEIGQVLGLPAQKPGGASPYDRLSVPAAKFDDKGRILIVMANRCELQGVHGVTSTGETEEKVLTSPGWEDEEHPDHDFTGVLAPNVRHGIYSELSFKHDDKIPVSKLVLVEPEGTNKWAPRKYDIKVECNGQARTIRVDLPPLPPVDKSAEFVCSSDSVPYDEMLADGMLYSLLPAGYNTIDIDDASKVMRDMGFTELTNYRKDDVDYPKFFADTMAKTRQITTGDRSGETVHSVDALHTHAHLNGYEFSSGLFRAPKRGATRMFRKYLPNGKPYYVRLLTPRAGEGKKSEDGFLAIDYSPYLDALRARKNPLVVFRGSCLSEDKCGFIHANVQNPNITLIPTTDLVDYWSSYWSPHWEDGVHRKMHEQDSHYSPIMGMSRMLNYDQMGEAFPKLITEFRLPNHEDYCSKMKGYVRSVWAQQQQQQTALTSTQAVEGGDPPLRHRIAPPLETSPFRLDHLVPRMMESIRIAPEAYIQPQTHFEFRRMERHEAIRDLITPDRLQEIRDLLEDPDLAPLVTPEIRRAIIDRFPEIDPAIRE